MDTYLLGCDNERWLRPLLTSPGGISHASRSGTRRVAVSGKGRSRNGRRRRVVKLEEVWRVEASKTERVVFEKSHPWDGDGYIGETR